MLLMGVGLRAEQSVSLMIAFKVSISSKNVI